MKLPSQLMTMGTALQYAQNNGERVQVTADGQRFEGHVMEMDSQGVLLYSDLEHRMTVVRLDQIAAVSTTVPEDDRPAIPMGTRAAYA